jgi:predicted aspartyl protease
MKCNDLQQRLDTYLDGDLDTILVSMFEQHITECSRCNSMVNHAKSVQSGLKQLTSLQSDANEPSEKFISKAFENVKSRFPENQVINHKNRISVKTGFITAVAAGFTLWAVLTTFILPGIDLDSITGNQIVATNITEKVSTIASINIKLDETRVVRLAIDTPDEFDKVTLSVILPKHIELDGHKNKRTLTWDTKLVKGNNILRIPLKAINYGQGNFIAKITHNGKVKMFKLILKSDKPDYSDIYRTEFQV